MRLRARRDTNERAIVAALRDVPGCHVTFISGPGVPDLLVGYKKRYFLLEVKLPKGRFKPLQVAFHQTATALGLPCYVVRDIDTALTLIGAQL